MRELSNKPTFLSLFSGCGGFDLGFIQAGYSCIAAFDQDPQSVAVHHRNLRSPASQCDLELENLDPVTFGNTDLIVAGPPCQGFSTLGKRRLDDPRNNLLLQTGLVAARIRPKVLVVENVCGVASGHHAAYWNGLREIMRCSGFRTTDFIVEAHKIGLPQIRRRRIFLAWRTGADNWPRLPEAPGGSLGSVLSRICGATNHHVSLIPVDSTDYRIAVKIQSGQKLSNVRGGPASVHTWHIPEVFGRTTNAEAGMLELIMRLRRSHRVRDWGDADPVGLHLLREQSRQQVDRCLASLLRKGYLRRIGSTHVDLTHTFNGKYRRMSLEQPSNTVDTRFGDPRYFLHPTEHRGFTVREAARIQGFPDEFVFCGSETAQYRQVGNAVPPPVGFALARYIRAALLSP